MKHSALFILILLSAQHSIFAQSTLNVGNLAPEITAFRWLKGKPVMKFEKGRVYVVEFGATWCKPCAEAIPHLSAISRELGDQVTVISFFVMENNSPNIDSSYVKKVERYLDKNGNRMDYTVGVDDPRRRMEINWLKSAGKEGIPYSFIIDKNGYVAWIGSSNDKLKENLKLILKNDDNNNNDVSTPLKKSEDIIYDQTKLLLINNNGGKEDEFEYRSLLTKDNGKIKTGHHGVVDSYRWAKKGSMEEQFQGKVQEISASMLHLYNMAYADTVWNYPNSTQSDFYTSYGKYWYKPLLEVKDSTPFITSGKSSKNKFNYSLKVPREKASAQFLQQAMQRDLLTYFGYRVNVEKRAMPCWRMTISKEARKRLVSKTQGLNPKDEYFDVNSGIKMTNAKVKGLIFVIWGYTLRQVGPPIIDDTGLTEDIDIEIQGSILNWKELVDKLKLQGIIIEKSQLEMNVVMIRDPI